MLVYAKELGYLVAIEDKNNGRTSSSDKPSEQRAQKCLQVKFD